MATHAEEDAMQYLSEKYDMDFELKSFEPDIYVDKRCELVCTVTL